MDGFFARWCMALIDVILLILSFWFWCDRLVDVVGR